MKIERGERRKPGGGSFMFRLILMISVLAFVVLMIRNPDWISKPLNAFSSLGGFIAPHGMNRLMGTYKSGLMQVHAAENGDVLMVDKYLITRFPGGDPELGAPIFDIQELRGQWGDVNPGSLAMVTTDPDGTVWTGSWTGVVLRQDGGNWSLVVAPTPGPDGKPVPGTYPKSQVKALAWVGDDVLVLSYGLWRVAPDGRTTPVPGLVEDRLYTTAMVRRADGDFIVGTNKGLFRVTPPSPAAAEDETSASATAADALGLESEAAAAPAAWRAESFLPLETAGSVEALAVDGDQLISVTARTVTQYAADGNVITQTALGEALQTVSITPEGDWLVTCRKTGLYIHRGGNWLFLPFPEGLHDARVDAHGRLWAVVYSQAGLVGDYALALESATPLTTPAPAKR